MKTSLENKYIAGLDVGSSHTTFIVGQIEAAGEATYDSGNQRQGALGVNAIVGTTVSDHTHLHAHNTEHAENSFHHHNNGNSALPGTGVHAAPTRINILGAARVHNSGMRRGTMVNLDAVTGSILEALDEVERQTGLDIDSVRVGVSSLAAVSDNYTESYSLRNNEVRQGDLDKLQALVRSQKALPGQDFIHLLPGQFILDGKTGVHNPLGMYGTTLAAIYHRVAFPQADLHNVVRACNNAGLRVQAAVFESLAASQAVLDADEKELGACCINIGCNLTHVAVYMGGVPVFCKDYPIGSHHITKDLSIGLRTTQSEAERIKREFGQAIYTSYDAQEPLEIATMDPKIKRSISKGHLAHIIDPRVREILATVHSDLKKQKLAGYITKGIVLSGGGALLNGICIVAEEVFGIHCRIGQPIGISGLVEGLRSPAAAAAIGLMSPVFDTGQPGSRVLSRGSNVTQQGFSTFAKTLWGRLVEPFSS